MDEGVGTASSVTKMEDNCVPRVEVSGSVFRFGGKEALGSVILDLSCVDVQTMAVCSFSITPENG